MGWVGDKSSQRSISRDLTVGLILVVFFVSTIALLTAFWVSKKKAEAELSAKADEYMAFIKDTLVLPLWNYDFETIHAVCRTYLQNDLITAIHVSDVRGRLNISLEKQKAPPSFSRTVNLSHLGIPIGSVEISLTHGYLTDFNRQLFSSFALIILVNLVSLLVFTGILLRMSLKRPLDRLNAIVGEYAAGKYRAAGSLVPHAELAPLVTTLDQMGSKILHQLSTIRRAEQKFRGIFENAIEGIYQSTPKGRILSANPAFARILGYESAEELMARVTDMGGQHWVDPKDRHRLLEALGSGKALSSFEARMKKKDGQRIWMLVNVRPVFDDTGKLRLLEGMVQDITHRMAAEAELRRLSTAVEQVAESIMIFNSQNRIDYVNPAFELTTGFSRNEVMGKPPDLLAADRGSRAAYQEIRRTVASGRVWTGRIFNQRKNRALLIMETAVSPIKGRSGRFMGWVAVGRDVTEKVRFENQLRQSQKMEAIGTLAGGIAHDFNNILGVIIGCSELAMDQIPKNSRARADMEHVLDAGLRAKSLVSQILTFSRQGESEQKPLLLAPFVKEVAKFLRATLPASLEIRLTLEPGNHVALTDPTQMQQVMLNLLTNSAHAMEPDGGVIEIVLSRVELGPDKDVGPSDLKPGPYVSLKVKDAGCGIDKKDIHRIFDPFFTTKPVGKGTGLGLSVVHGIVQNHGGAVEVHSEKGKGTTVRVLLPSLEHPDIRVSAGSAALPPEGDEEILLVEDETVLGRIIQRLLTGLGYKVTAFDHPVRALEYFTDHPRRFDLALLDYNMPEINGIEFAGQLGKQRPGLGIILYTGGGIEPLRPKAAKVGIHTILNKPLERIQLATAIRRVLDESRCLGPKTKTAVP